MDTLTYNVVIGFLVSYVLQWFKGSPAFPWLTAQTTRLNFWLSGFVALLVSIGITFEFAPTEGTLLVSGLTFANVGTHLWAWIQQWLSQQVAYDFVVQKAGKPAVTD